MKPSLPHRGLLLPLLLASTLLMAGCGGGADPHPSSPVQVGSISGQISDPFALPLAGVSVTAEGTREHFSSTNDQGRFLLSMLPPGTYSLSFALMGFEPHTETVQVQAATDTRLRVTLTPMRPRLGSISGQVSDPFGAPVVGASVRVTGTRTDSSTTDGSGQFQLTGLPEGSYSLNVSRTGFESRSESVRVAAEQDSWVQVTLSPESMPSAGSRSVRVASHAGSRLEFEVDVLVIGANGLPLDGLGSDAFSIRDFDDLRFASLGVSHQAGGDVGPYSAVLLMDQSGSILSTDPADSRIQAGKTFFSALSAPDKAQLAAFASGGFLPHDPVTVWGDFTSVGSTFYGPLDALAGLEGGNTPLYASTATMIDYVVSKGSTPNRAVVLFTDGQDTDGIWSLKDVISLAQARHVKLFTVGLSNSINFDVLNQMAAATQGAMLWAADARQLISIYGSLGNLLRGSAAFYRTRWSATLGAGTWGAGGWLSTSVEIRTPMGTLWAPFYLEIPRTGALPGISHTPSTPCTAEPVKGLTPVLCLAR